MIIRNKEKDRREEEAYRPEALDFRSVEADAPSLEALEAGSVDLLAMLRQRREEENAQFAVPERTFVEGEPEEVPTSQQVNKSTNKYEKVFVYNFDFERIAVQDYGAGRRGRRIVVSNVGFQGLLSPCRQRRRKSRR